MMKVSWENRFRGRQYFTVGRDLFQTQNAECINIVNIRAHTVAYSLSNFLSSIQVILHPIANFDAGRNFAKPEST